MANLGPINAHETLDEFRELAETYCLAGRPIYGLGKVGMRAYNAAVVNIAPLYFANETERQQVVQDMKQPNCIIVEHKTTPQKVFVRAMVLGETATMAALFAVGLESKRFEESGQERTRHQRLSTELSYEGVLSSHYFISNWLPPFALPKTDTIDPQIGMAVGANYNRGFGAILNAVEQFNIMLSPVS